MNARSDFGAQTTTDEVHKMVIARRELKRFPAGDGG